MSQTYQVMPGAATELFKQLAAGNIIVNQDQANAIWLSADANVAPGRGYRLGPLGSLTWKEQSGLWICVDTNVTTNVPITIGPEIQTPVNPVDTTMASMMSGIGIPNTLLLEPLYDGSIDGVPYLNVHKYGSILVQLRPDPQITNGAVTGTFCFFLENINYYVNRSYIISFYDENNWPLLFEYVNYGDNLSFIKYYDSSTHTPSNSIITIIGSNRFIKSDRIKSPFGGQPTHIAWSGAVTAGQTVQLAPPAGWPAWTAYNGVVKGHLIAYAPDAAPTITFQLNTRSLSVNPVLTNLINTNSVSSHAIGAYYVDMLFDFIHPFQPLNYSCTIAEAHTSINIDVFLTGT